MVYSSLKVTNRRGKKIAEKGVSGAGCLIGVCYFCSRAVPAPRGKQIAKQTRIRGWITIMAEYEGAEGHVRWAGRGEQRKAINLSEKRHGDTLTYATTRKKAWFAVRTD